MNNEQIISNVQLQIPTRSNRYRHPVAALVMFGFFLLILAAVWMRWYVVAARNASVGAESSIESQIILSNVGIVEECNGIACKALGLSSCLVGRDLADLMSVDYREDYRTRLQKQQNAVFDVSMQGKRVTIDLAALEDCRYSGTLRIRAHPPRN